MNKHPALSMLLVWGGCVAAYFVLPYQLVDKQLSWQGGLVLLMFITAFVAGTLLVPAGPRPQSFASGSLLDAARGEKWLMAASIGATLCFLLDVRDKDLFDLAVAYELRSEAADALLKADASNSSVWFQLAFLLYPAAYVYLAVHGVYARRVSLAKMAGFGFLPIVLATVSMGGRVPIFYAVLVAWMAMRERVKAGHPPAASRPKTPAMRLLITVGWIVGIGILAYYFAAVFMVRAAVVGGASEMFEVAEERWGISFRGPFSGVIFGLLGDEATYLLFVFVWYLVQGLVIGNFLFTSYDGPMQLGIYGVDLVSALMRRLDPQRVAEGFDSLLTLGTYGFLPSAWGSLYVDFSFFGVFFCAVWGAFTALAFKRIVRERRREWVFIGPFISIGIFFSVINTPLGFTNGFVTHAWMLLVFLLIRPQRATAASPLGHEGSSTAVASPSGVAA